MFTFHSEESNTELWAAYNRNQFKPKFFPLDFPMS